MAARKKITSLKGRKITDVKSSGMYFILKLDRGGEMQVHVDSLFDKDGTLFEDNAPTLTTKRAG